MRSVLLLLSVVVLAHGGFSPAHADDQAECKPILTKAIKATGRADKLKKLKAGTFKGKASGNDHGLEVVFLSEGTWQGSDQIKMDAVVKDGAKSRKATLVINGENGWINHGDKAEDAPKELVTFIKNFSYALRLPQLLPQLQDMEFQLSPLGEVKIDSVEAIGIKIVHKDFTDVSLFFDKKEGFPIKSEVKITNPQSKELTFEFLYSDYKDFDGIKCPVKIVLHADGIEFTMELSEIKSSDKVDDSVFGKP
jgi:hypothetical protein